MLIGMAHIRGKMAGHCITEWLFAKCNRQNDASSIDIANNWDENDRRAFCNCSRYIDRAIRGDQNRYVFMPYYLIIDNESQLILLPLLPLRPEFSYRLSVLSLWCSRSELLEWSSNFVNEVALHVRSCTGTYFLNTTSPIWAQTIADWFRKFFFELPVSTYSSHTILHRRTLLHSTSIDFICHSHKGLVNCRIIASVSTNSSSVV